MTSPDPAIGDEVARVKAIQDNAERLGLTWALRPGTVTTADPLTVQVDGDTESIGMVSMIGNLVSGQRVYVIKVPPSGNFVAGFMAAPSIPAYWQDRQRIGSTTASILFVNIPVNLRTLRVKWRVRVTGAVATTDVTMRVNSDGSAAYNDQILQVNGGTVLGVAVSPYTGFRLGICAGATAPAGMYGSGTADLIGWDPPYSGFLGCTMTSQAMASGLVIEMNGAAYNTAGPYTSLLFVPGSGSFASGTDIQLDGTYA